MSYIDENEGEGRSIFTNIAAVIGAAGGWAVSHYFGLAAVLPMITGLVGLVAMGLYAKNRSVDITPIKVMAWSNLVTWLVPILGMITSAATLGAIAKSATNSTLYKILGAIGIALSLGNFWLAVWLRAKGVELW